MILRRRRQRLLDPAVHVAAGGFEALVLSLHGYGASETQFSTLVPLRQPVVQVAPRAPFAVDPGYGWWEPEHSADGSVELAPSRGVSRAVDVAHAAVTSAQTAHGFSAERTVLLGYSQGAMLALLLAARHPELMSAVATGAGFLLAGQSVSNPGRALDVLVMNGSLDLITSRAEHDSTVDRFVAAGHRVVAHRDPVPHVIDQAQAVRVDHWIQMLLEQWGRDV